MGAVAADDRWAAPVPRARAVGWLAAQYALWLAFYMGVNAATAGRNVGQPFLPGESRIPLIPAAYPFYAAVYLEILLPVLLCRTRGAFFRTQAAIGIASVLAFAVFLAAPMAYPRPVIPTPHGLEWMLRLEWALDGPRCTFPSLHVATAVLLYLGLRDQVPRWRWPLLALAVAIAVSTVLVKQHFVVDVLGGALLAVGSWWLTPRLLRHLGVTGRGA
jgi:membrane-associated phospholipid phosphatase